MQREQMLQTKSRFAHESADVVIAEGFIARHNGAYSSLEQVGRSSNELGRSVETKRL